MASETREDWIECGCGHTAIQHHGTDPNDGCMVVGMRSNPDWCGCSMTCPEVVAAWDASPKRYLFPSHFLARELGTKDTP